MFFKYVIDILKKACYLDDKYKKRKRSILSMKTTLVIMAAGIGSRFGDGIKQLAPVGLNGEIIMDYSIHDAIEAGFNKIVFIIRKDIKEAFKEAIGDRIEKICKDLDVEIAYAYQELNELPEGVELLAGRIGTTVHSWLKSAVMQAFLHRKV